MRKLVLTTSVSLDGFFEAPGHDLSWHLVDEELHRHFNDWLGRAGAFLEGRVTYELMAESWATTDPGMTPTMAEFAEIWRDMPKVVYSKTLDRADWHSVVLRDVVPDQVVALKEEPGGDLVLGGANVARSFLAHHLVDELRLYVHPVVVGRGTPFFQLPDLRETLHLVETHVFGNGVVLLRYAFPPRERLSSRV